MELLLSLPLAGVSDGKTDEEGERKVSVTVGEIVLVCDWLSVADWEPGVTRNA